MHNTYYQGLSGERSLAFGLLVGCWGIVFFNDCFVILKSSHQEFSLLQNPVIHLGVIYTNVLEGCCRSW